MNSLEWRTKKLENKILGERASSLPQVERILSQAIDQPTIHDQLSSVAESYRTFLDHSGLDYAKFVDLYTKCQTLTSDQDAESNIATKIDLVLAYQDDLIKYTQDLKSMTEKAERVLNVENWPDLSGVQGKVENLQKINKEQHIQSVVLDKRTEELIELYNDIISSFRSNMTIWNQKLEAYENEEKKPEEDE